MLFRSDPFSITVEGARFRRQPVPGNIVPAARISPTAQAFYKYFPLPNASGTADFTNNYVRARPDLLLVLGMVFFAGTFGLNFQITSALMATEVFGKGPEEFGLLGTFLAIGSLTGSLLAARRSQVRHRLVVGSALAFGTSVVLAGLMPTYLAFAVLAPVTGAGLLTLVSHRPQGDFLIGLPFYFCSGAELPLVHQLLGKGMGST